jgi:prepilin-type N-terminal cleavage/methylation domain-containing protein
MNERGFTLIEMLLSISVLFMLSSIIVPPLMKIFTERKNMYLENAALQFLMEQRHYYFYDSTNMTNELEIEGVKIMLNINNKKICSTWMNKSNKEEQLCRGLD